MRDVPVVRGGERAGDLSAITETSLTGSAPFRMRVASVSPSTSSITM
jgi:hypothetical protein